MKKIIPTIVLALFVSFTLTTCETMDSETQGALAGVGAGLLAGALGASDADAQRIAQGVSKGVATYAESKKAADSLTPENEYYLGRAVAANISAKYKIYSNAEMQKYLAKTPRKLTPLPRPADISLLPRAW